MKTNPLIKLFFILIFAGLATHLHAQIGYQVSLIDTKTGEPQANKTVQVTVTLSDNAGTNIISQTQSATSDALGVISLTIGNSQTFKDVDWDKLPFWVTASVDGITIGRTQVLTVPVAEYAKRTGDLTVKKLCSRTWPKDRHFSFSFYSNGSGVRFYSDPDYPENNETQFFSYYIWGNMIGVRYDEGYSQLLLYNPNTGRLL